MELTFDHAVFAEALRAYKVTSGNTFANTLNHAMKNVAYRAAQFTEFTVAAKIRAELQNNPRLVRALVIKLMRQKGMKKISKAKLELLMKHFINRRASSARYLRSAFARAAIDLGGEWRGRKFERGADGYGNEATPRRLEADVVAILEQPNSAHADSAEKLLLEAVEKAFAFVVDDLKVYAERKMREDAKAHSG